MIMGVPSTDTDCNVEMTSKPKERQFQVVPVPGFFTRGRWKCWDYREEVVTEDKVVSLSDKIEKLTPSNEEEEEPVIEMKKLYVLLFEPGTTELKALPMTTETLVSTTLDLPITVDSLTQAASELQLPTDGMYNSNVIGTGIAVVGESVNSGKESSTIVVTSIAPAPVTPVHATSSPAPIPTSSEPLVASSTIHMPIVSSTLTILSEEEAAESSSAPLSLSLAQGSATTGISLASSVSPQGIASSNVSNTAFVSPSATNPASGVSSASVFFCPSSGIVSQPSRQVLSRETSAPQNTSSPVLSRQTSLASFSDTAVTSLPMLSPIEAVLEDPTVAGNASSGPNVVAIDNKIEQAMDLVKTHLTFAVREEVEILRSTIVDLEAKVTQLESQNQILRQFAPPEVLSNIGYYIQKKKEAQQTSVSSTASVPPG